MTDPRFRTEHDSMGEVAVPARPTQGVPQMPSPRADAATGLGHRQREDVVESQGRCRAYAVRVEAEPRYFALRQIELDGLAVHRRCDQQREDPQQQRPVQLAAGHPPVAEREAAQHRPGQGHHHGAGGGHR